MINAAEIESRLKAAFPDATVRIHDLTGGSDHFDVTVISTAFEGVRPVQRHRMVYAPLRDVLGGALHALALKTQTPAEAQQDAGR